MADFQFVQNPTSHTWTILAPRRAKRPDTAKGAIPICPFCPGREGEEQEVYRISVISSQFSVVSKQFVGLSANQVEKQTTGKPISENREPKTDNWSVRVLPNKFPFAPVHEIIIHSQDHHKNFEELPQSQVELILQAYRHRYNEHSHKGQVYIFHNRGEAGGESIPHPHTQLAVVPFGVTMEIPALSGVFPDTKEEKFEIQSTKLETNSNNQILDSGVDVASQNDVILANEVRPESVSNFEFRYSSFSIVCPTTSQWPDEVWIVPLERGKTFGEITDKEITSLAEVLQKLILILDLRHGHEFPFNFYIYPGNNWYLRLIPRVKTLGGFELGTGIFVNTQDPRETIEFIKEHFEQPDVEKIKREQRASYKRHV